MGKKNNLIFSLFGIYFTVLAILAFVNAFINPEIAHPLWFSYITLLLIGIGILAKNSKLILVQLNIITIPVIFWNIDFFYQLINNKPLFGITDYLFDGGFTGSLGNFISLQHLYTIPIALVFIFLLGIKKSDLWKWGFFEALFIFLATLFTSPERNINCVFESCLNFISLSNPYYQVFWIFSVFVLIYLTNFLFIYLLKKTNKFKTS